MEQHVTLKQGKFIAGKQADPSKIMQIGMGFWASKVLLAGIKFRLFTLLAGKSLKGPQIREILKLETTQRHVYDWLDALVSLGFLHREGILDSAVYKNAPDANMFLDQNKLNYIGGILEMSNNRLYRFWGDLEEGLLTGLPQNESKQSGNGQFFEDLYKDPVKLHEFVDAMSGIQMNNFLVLAGEFNFSQYKTLADIGGADGLLSIQVCRRHPHIRCTTFDLPPVETLAKKKIAQFNLDERIHVVSGDFTKDPLPKADVITMGNILHGLNEEAKQQLIRKVYETLPPGGAFIAVENIIDDERRQNTFGLLMSLNMLIENGDGFDYSLLDFGRWAKEAGFKNTGVISLSGSTSAAIAYK
jgi:precorrin-6B methylase 2